MSHAPWYKRYAADFVSDPYVQAMTAEQYGWFSAALDLMWIHTPQGYLPNDKQLLCKMIGRCTEEHFIEHCDIVLNRFKVTDDGIWLYHPHMLEQASDVTELSEKRAEAGKRGGKKNARSNCKAIAKQLPTDLDIDTDKEIKPTPPTPSKRGRSSRRPKTLELLSGYPDEVREVVNTLCGEWPTKQPKDNKPIHVDTAQFAGRVKQILLHAKSPPERMKNILIRSAREYLKQPKGCYHAPQYFFGPGNGHDPPWFEYAEYIVHLEQQQEAVDERVQ